MRGEEKETTWGQREYEKKKIVKKCRQCCALHGREGSELKDKQRKKLNGKEWDIENEKRKREG